MRALLIILLVLVFGCESGHQVARPRRDMPTKTLSEPDKPKNEPLMPKPENDQKPADNKPDESPEKNNDKRPEELSLPLENRFLVNGTISKNADAVLTAAFDTDYGDNEGDVNAYDFPKYHGNKGMDWWNFPWDLPSSRPQFTITYDDMKDMLEKVKVRKTRDKEVFIPYSEMLKDMVLQLTPPIMNAHGGVLRVTKIIYCLRNFLAVAIKHALTKDIGHLKAAAQKLIDLHATNMLIINGSPYLRNDPHLRGLSPLNIQGEPEDRTPTAGIEDLKQMLQS
jgi:hypothetical protein